MSNLTVVKQFPKKTGSWKVGGVEAKDIEIREATVKDLTAAEKEANPALHPNAFNVALACETIVRAGTFTGPFVSAHFDNMPAKQWAVVREAMQETSELGED